ncbi:hypothetical protein AVEN_163291-1 [Araneus ventricosus]|uniref:Uncharacterized protein n=1 Tax=Araneus ventricosus TaxID=182803 RepID=A0A4Y2LGS0_ARAVE|nr:hypothetical protein AVEN_163291-1 [Araneus ventricosus]
MRKFREGAPVQVLTLWSSSDRCSRLRCPSRNSSRVPSKRDAHLTKLPNYTCIYSILNVLILSCRFYDLRWLSVYPSRSTISLRRSESLPSGRPGVSCLPVPRGMREHYGQQMAVLAHRQSTPEHLQGGAVSTLDDPLLVCSGIT